VAPNKFLAKIASDWRKPDGLFVIRPHQVFDFLTPLPVGTIPGVGKVMREKLAALGIATVGDLRGLGAERLQHAFGNWGLRLHEYAQGIDERAVETDQPVQSISSEDTFERDVPIGEVEPMIRRLAEKTWAAAQRDSARVGRTVVLKLKTAQFRILTRSHTPDAPPASLEQFVDIALSLRDRVDLPPSTRYRLVGVGLGNFRDRDALLPPQAVLFGD
jgi:DNA polymerase-4